MSDADGSPIGIGVIGLGFMGCTHVRAYQSAAQAGLGCKLIAVADRSAERLNGRAFVQGNIDTGSNEQLFDPSRVHGYVDPRQLLTDPRVDAVSVCTHTDTHVDLAIAALRAGKHVLVEKPVATSSADVRRLATVASESGKVCMPAMVMRFWPEWTWLRDTIRSGTHGRVLSASFQRMGSAPAWTDFYRDTTRSGGALYDLHIHDADFIRWCFGEPREIVSAGTIDHLTTLYRFAGDAAPAHVAAEGAQNITPGFGFRMRYTVVFERATADFDITRTPTLLLCKEGRADPVPFSPTPALSAYEIEVRHFLSIIHAVATRSPGDATPSLIASIDDAVQTTALLEAEQRSMTRGQPERMLA